MKLCSSITYSFLGSSSIISSVILSKASFFTLALPSSLQQARTLRTTTSSVQRQLSNNSNSNSNNNGNNYIDSLQGTTKMTKDTTILPTMIVFDLDDCLWSPEMYTLHAKPSIPEYGDLGDGQQGVVGMKVPPSGPTVRLFSDARKVLRELATDPKYKDVLIASASSSEEPTFSYACLEGIEILPGLTMSKMFKYNQIGRTGKLTSDKITHFQLLHQESKVPYNEQLFFDDCNWGDHCSRVSRAFGVVSQATPSGLQYSEFTAALNKYNKEAQDRT